MVDEMVLSLRVTLIHCQVWQSLVSDEGLNWKFPKKKKTSRLILQKDLTGTSLLLGIQIFPYLQLRHHQVMLQQQPPHCP